MNKKQRENLINKKQITIRRYFGERNSEIKQVTRALKTRTMTTSYSYKYMCVSLIIESQPRVNDGTLLFGNFTYLLPRDGLFGPLAIW